jgi:hypothetical protein
VGDGGNVGLPVRTDDQKGWRRRGVIKILVCERCIDLFLPGEMYRAVRLTMHCWPRNLMLMMSMNNNEGLLSRRGRS